MRSECLPFAKSDGPPQAWRYGHSLRPLKVTRLACKAIEPVAIKDGPLPLGSDSAHYINMKTPNFGWHSPLQGSDSRLRGASEKRQAVLATGDVSSSGSVPEGKQQSARAADLSSGPFGRVTGFWPIEHP